MWLLLTLQLLRFSLCASTGTGEGEGRLSRGETVGYGFVFGAAHVSVFVGARVLVHVMVAALASLGTGVLSPLPLC